MDLKIIDTYEKIQKNIPSDLTSLIQWVTWSGTVGNNGKTIKLPIDAKSGRFAKTNDPKTWSTFDEALEYGRSKGLPGIGFVFSESDEFVGIDLDDCRNKETGKMDEVAEGVVSRLKSYTEISPSGKGLHIFVKGKLPKGPRKKNKVEMYDTGRFFTMTGDTLENTSDCVLDRSGELIALYQELFADPGNNIRNSATPIQVDNQNLAKNAADDEKKDKFNRLLKGDFQDYPSQSEADLALCRLLAIKTNGDAKKMDQLFRQSGLFRPKWDETHFAGGNTYGLATIEKAIQSVDIGSAQSSPQKNHAPIHRDFHLTDLGNAERLVYYFEDRIRYCHAWKTWLIWDGVRWTIDQSDQINQFAKQVIRKIYSEAETHSDPNRRQAIAKHAISSESARRIASMIALAESELPIIPEDLDRDPWLLTCLNGTLDLRTGVLLPHRREDFITKLAKVNYNPTSPCRQWYEFLNRIMGGSERLISFLQRAIGYSLTGDTSEQCLFIFHGSGANGKTTFLQTIGFVLGDYAMSTPTETLLVKQRGSIPNDVARLKGSRFVTASEAEAEQRLAESLIKTMTGGDTITARFLHQEWFDFKPTHKFFIGTNYKPVIKGSDYAIWRRIRLVPFETTIPEDERDKHLFDKLKQEADGIFAWAVQGCLSWQEHGLGEPEEVKTATNNYREEMDVLAEFLNDRCILNPNAKVPRKDLFRAYVSWCEENGQFSIPRRSFVVLMHEKGFKDCRFGTKSVRGWLGVGL